jgi:hypothetical protein
LRTFVFGAVLALQVLSGGLACAEAPAAAASGVSDQALDALDLHATALDNSVTLAAGTGEGAAGNLGVNAVSGDFNLQQNLVVFAAAGDGAADVSAEASQNSADLFLDGNISNSVTAGAGLLQEASGNIGLNAAAGAFNLQQNMIVIAAVDLSTLAASTAALSQHAENSGARYGASFNSIMLDTNLSAASGNIGLNIASGTGNSQMNLVALANPQAAH